MKMNISPIVNGLVLAIVVGIGGIMVAAMQGHATDDAVKVVAENVKRVEKEAKARAKEIEGELKEHTKEAQKEWRAQSAFRAALAEKLKVTLPPEG